MVAIRTEVESVFRYGANVGATQVIAPTFEDPETPAPQVKPWLDYLDALSIAIERLNQTGATVFPVRLPSYTVATVPAAAANVGSMIYVSNGAAGLPIVAFSDGAAWLRVDTREVIA
jgi:hypothetical protein